ncbi:MAG TPA: diacylglycerol kinase family lipid kinase [Desulfuromonadales bacterium]|nr:diacylglycerol kinase family lipid kinase [Desulfuromonadales bacterium]
MNTYLFINPSSGSHSSEKRLRIVERLRSEGLALQVLEVRNPDEIRANCQTINRDSQQHLVVVAGGDGTFNATVNALEPGSATLAVLPLGTSNVLAAELGIRSLDDGIARIAAGKSRPLSLGVIELADGSSHRFVLMAGIGLDGAAVRNVVPLWKKYLRQGGYALSVARTLLSWDSSTFGAVAGGTAVTCHSLIVCNAGRYAGNFILAPESSLFEEGLTAVCITGNRRRSYAGITFDLFCGTNVAGSGLIRLSAAEVTIDGSKPIQVDGDFVGYGPARITTLGNFARIIV